MKNQDLIMVKVRISTYCKHCGNREIVETERAVDGVLAGDIHCGQCGEITDRDLEELI
jgi:transcription elongation factor Elf1